MTLSDHAPLRLSASYGALNSKVAPLLAAHRNEEDQTEIRLIETSFSDQMRGLQEGTYDLGLSLAPATSVSISSLPLHQEEIVLAVPTRSPLLAYERVPTRELEQYPIVLWSRSACAPMSSQIEAMLEGVSVLVSAEAKSSGVMVSLVAAGYGIAIGVRSQIEAARGHGIIMRPIAGPPRYLTTYLLHREATSRPSVRRFVKRASSLLQPQA